MRRKLGITAALVVALAMAGYAQKKPDFSGTWTLDTEKSDPMPQRQGGGGGGAGMAMAPITIKQTADTLTIERTGPNGTMATNYKLDGTESEIQMMGRGGQTTAKAKAKWDGDKIVIETTREGQNGPVTTKAKYSLDGANLVVETENPQGTRKSVYKKTT